LHVRSSNEAGVVPESKSPGNIHPGKRNEKPGDVSEISPTVARFWAALRPFLPDFNPPPHGKACRSKSPAEAVATIGRASDLVIANFRKSARVGGQYFWSSARESGWYGVRGLDAVRGLATK